MRLSIMDGSLPVPADASELRVVDLVPGRHRVRCLGATGGAPPSSFRVVDPFDLRNASDG
jgi:hypothetical protein